MILFVSSAGYFRKRSVPTVLHHIGITSFRPTPFVHGFMVPNIFLSVGEGSIKKGKEL
jgi:hypothetical protein